MDLRSFSNKASQQKKENREFYRRLRSRTPGDLDKVFHELHDEVFERTDCLLCANCCKTTSPIFYERDVERAARALRIKPGEFIEKYLRMDEDKDLVLKSSPCTFLNEDNTCSIYEQRPNACREYPHTNRKKMFQVLDLAAKNTMVCPAVLEMTNKLKEIYK